MKKLYFLVAGLFSILAFACTKDKTTSGDKPLPAFAVSGLQTSYSVLTLKDTLRINPAVQDESRYEFYWTAFASAFIQGSGNLKPDTLAKTKNLNYAVILNPGPYILVFNLKDKETGITKLMNVDMNVATLNMNGWYLLKENGGKTDFDFIYNAGRIDNWIAFNNEGKSLEGKPVTAVFTPSFKMTLTSTDLFSAFTVLSEKDAAIYRIDNGKAMRTFDDMFFTKPPTRKLQSAYQPLTASNLGLINDGKAYTMTKGTLFSTMPATTARLSPLTAIAALGMGFDEISKSLVLIDGYSFPTPGTNAADLKNMNADLIWINGYTGGRSGAVLLFRKPDGTGQFFKLNAAYGFLAGFSSPLVLAKPTVPQEHGIMGASAIAGNYDNDFIYYAVGNKVYLTDVVTIQESLQLTLGAGETVTDIQHIKYPQPAQASIPITLDFLAIATYANGRYKVYLHKISSTGTIQALAQPNFEGEGRVTNITYMEQGNGSRTF